MKRSCIICRTEFETLQSYKTCSETCQITHHKNTRKLSDKNIAVIRFCRFCGESFEAKRHKTKYFANILMLEKRKIIEYNGDYWHCNPNKYMSDYFNKKIKKYAKEIWENDLHRRKSLESLGYSILCIWESDFINNREIIEQQIKQFVTC